MRLPWVKIRLCKKCDLPFLPMENADGEPIWYCSSCKDQRDRKIWKDYLEDFRDGPLMPGLIITTIIAVVVGGLGLLIWAESESHKEDNLVKTWMIFYSPEPSTFYDPKRACEDYLKQIKREARENGVPCTVEMVDPDVGSIKITTSKAILNTAYRTLSTTVRPANDTDVTPAK